MYFAIQTYSRDIVYDRRIRNRTRIDLNVRNRNRARNCICTIMEKKFVINIKHRARPNAN